MSVQAIHDTFAVMAVVALAGTVLMVLSRVIASVPTVRFLDGLYKVQLPLAALVAVTATLGSLYFSEASSTLWSPCRFCWFQRIFMYSAALVLVVAAIRRDRGARWYAVALAGIGLLVSTWHILLEHNIVKESAVCALTVPCATPNKISFGSFDPNTARPAEWHAVTLAVMAFCGFAAILALLLTPEPLDTPEEEEDGQSSAG